MFFQLFGAITDRVREQAADYASAQARIVARTFAQAANPLGLAPVGATTFAPPAGAGEAGLQALRSRSGRGARRSSHGQAGRSPRRRRPSTLSVA